MDDAAYKQWWPLHRRTAVGDPLSVEEQAHYEAGLRELEAEEAPCEDGIEGLKEVRQRMLAAQRKFQDLQRLMYLTRSAWGGATAPLKGERRSGI